MTGQHFVAGLLAQIEAGTYAWRVPPMQPNHINVEIDAWIIQDGNYGEFAVGDGLTLAFEFVAESVFKTTNVKRSIKQIDGATYESARRSSTTRRQCGRSTLASRCTRN